MPLRTTITLASFAATAAFTLALTGGASEPAAPRAPETSTAAAPAAPAPVGKVQGKILFDGEPPKREEIKFNQDVCLKPHEGPVYKEDIVVGEGGGLRDCFIQLDGITGTFPAPKDPVVIDQVGCVFVPHVAGVQVGTELHVTSSDRTLHNFNYVSRSNGRKNVAIVTAGMVKKFNYTKPETFVYATCNVHSWMTCYIAVVPHPFFAVSNEKGEFEIANVPAGTYPVLAQHPKLGKQNGTVTVTDSGAAEVNFTFKPREKN